MYNLVVVVVRLVSLSPCGPRVTDLPCFVSMIGLFRETDGKDSPIGDICKRGCG